MIRLIARVDFRNGYHIKTIKCEGTDKIRPIKSSLELFSTGINEYDEIALVDNVASLYGCNNWLLREGIHYYCPIPLSVGGAITNESQAKATLDIGADKIIINTAAIENPSILEAISKCCGRQAVILQVDAKLYNNKYMCATHGTREISDICVKEWLSMAYELGVGEIHLTSIDSEGTSSRFSDELAEIAFSSSRLPIIISGGIRNASDIHHFSRNYGANSFSLSSIPNIHNIDAQSLRHQLKNLGLHVR